MEGINIRLDAFEGPLDLLYHLIEKNEIDIYDIPIASLTEQYMAYLDAAEDRDMDGMSEFLLMAATLLEIKSKMLLPKPKTEEEEGPDPREELVQRLLEYKKIKDATETLKEREEEAALVFYKEADASVQKLKEQSPQELEDLLQGITMDDLYLAFQQVMARKETKVDKVRSSFRSVPKDLFTVGEKMEYIRDLLILRPHGATAFHTIFRENAGKMEKVVTFLALLELIKQKEVQITQEKNFGEILIMKYREGETE
ncbi:segregation and condensation protein A [Anaerotignum sp.]|nr:segregation/condensation protein A [Anaerotignum sp.]MBQ7758424.1 segregation/condensation protein A [Anaerotignum sp.]